jgi:drug/metabolite transporter (DMT)-like permease
MRRGRLVALLQAFFVTFLWSSSYVLVKIGLKEIPPLSLVSLRYIVASVILIIAAVLKGNTRLLTGTRHLTRIAILGVSGYTLAQGLQCVGLFYLPAVSVTFLLNFTPVIVLVFGALVLKEYPRPHQFLGMALVMVGAYLYFGSSLSGFNATGALITLASGVGWATYLVMSRLTFLSEEVNPLELTSATMTVGTLILALYTFTTEGVPEVSPTGWAIILWLGAVNTALAFFLWNRARARILSSLGFLLLSTMSLC